MLGASPKRYRITLSTAALQFMDAVQVLVYMKSYELLTRFLESTPIMVSCLVMQYENILPLLDHCCDQLHCGGCGVDVVWLPEY